MEPYQPSLDSNVFRDIYSVSRLNRAAKQLLERGFPLYVWVEGEISNMSRPPSGHLYFSLKDNEAQVRCALFRTQLRILGPLPADGAHVIVRARVSLYEGRGEFQLIVDRLEEAGEGALRQALEALKRRLQHEGLFDVAHKKPLPRLPRRIGILTSPAGAVLHDIIITLRRRFPAIPVLLYPIAVQGEGAGQQIAAAIRLAAERAECDVLILARGGGSLEDLLAFNEEVVARAIFDCQIPIVCGVGHETDITLADLVADVRAPTPSSAAELVSPDQLEWFTSFAQKQKRLLRLMGDALLARQQRLDWLATRLVHPARRIALLLERLQNLQRRLRSVLDAQLQHRATELLRLVARLTAVSPRARVQALRVRCAGARDRLATAMEHRLEAEQQRLRRAVQSLHTLSPLATLARGYAILQRPESAEVIRDARALRAGEELRAQLAHGRADCIVNRTYEK
jgi:exodeoxyribonuclease VII large subunit